MLYHLMHRNDPVILINIDDYGHITNIGNNVYSPELLPLYCAQDTARLVHWWDIRAVPASRTGIEEFLKSRGYNGPRDYLVKNLGLSLTDQYWIKPLDSSLQWDRINLYQNDFRVDQPFLFPSYEKDSIPHYTPNSTLQGDIEKTWIISNGERILIKGNHGIRSTESLNEVLASEIYNRQGYDNYVTYQLVAIKDKMYDYGCKCKAFTDINNESISAYEVVESSRRNNDVSTFEHFVTLAVWRGIPEENVRRSMDMQILGDFVMSGQDRHLSNITIIRDPETLKFKSLAPIYDSGGSMFVSRDLPTTKKELATLETNSFASTEKKMLSYVTDYNTLDLSKLPSPEWVRELYAKDSHQTEYSINALAKIYEMKIDMLDDLQHGKDPFRILYAAGRIY